MSTHLIIKQLLEKRRIKQIEFGEVLNVGKQTANNYLNGRTKIIADDIPIIARFLRVPIMTFFETSVDLNSLDEIDYSLASNECQACKDKDETIAALKESNKMLKEKIAFLTQSKN